MKKSLVLLWCCLGTAFSLFSQSNNHSARLFLVQKEIVSVGDTLVLQVYAANFTQLDLLELSVQFPRKVLQWVGAALPVGSPRATIFATSLLNDSSNLLKVNWEDFSPPQGATIQDSLVLVELRFKTLQPTIGNEFAALVNFPTPIRALNIAGQSIPILDPNGDWQEGIKVLATDAIHFMVKDTMVAPGESFCRKIQTVEADTTLISMQFSMAWDPAIIRLDSVTRLNLSNFRLDNFNLGVRQSGKLSVAWLDTDLLGETLAPGAAPFEVCFTALDTMGNSEVRFTNTPTPIEFYGSGLTELRFYGTPALVAVTDDPMVRPGDTNRNGTVNNHDLLNIGLGYGNSGYQRSDLSLAWRDYPTPDWTQTSPQSQINYKHFDTDGNGLIESLDTRAIELNYNQTTPNLLPEALQIRSTGAPLYVQTQPIYSSTQPVKFPIILGEANQPAEKVYGLAFSIAYDSTGAGLNAASVSVDFSNTWLGEVGKDLLVLQKNNPAAHRIDLALVRIDGQNRNGFGAIGELEFTITARDTSDRFVFRVENVRTIDAQEVEQPTTPLETSAVVDLSTRVINPAIAHKITVFPNPTRNVLHIQATDIKVERVALYRVNGQLVTHYYNVNNLPVETLEAGIYFCKIFTDKGLISKKITVIR